MLQNYEALRPARKEEFIQGSMQGGVGETAASDLRREASGCKSLRSIKNVNIKDPTQDLWISLKTNGNRRLQSALCLTRATRIAEIKGGGFLPYGLGGFTTMPFVLQAQSPVFSFLQQRMQAPWMQIETHVRVIVSVDIVAA
jgi:hypothetical protein